MQFPCPQTPSQFRGNILSKLNCLIGTEESLSDHAGGPIAEPLVFQRISDIQSARWPLGDGRVLSRRSSRPTRRALAGRRRLPQ
jgi:hypothetical protein